MSTTLTTRSATNNLVNMLISLVCKGLGSREAPTLEAARRSHDSNQWCALQHPCALQSLTPLAAETAGHPFFVALVRAGGGCPELFFTPEKVGLTPVPVRAPSDLREILPRPRAQVCSRLS
jgi:hypothetical protein